MTSTDNDQWLVIGATMTAFGLAGVRPHGVTIIESSAAPAPEFAGAFYAGNGRPAASRSPAGAELAGELVARNILDRGRYHLSALVPVLMQRILDRNLRCLFWTDIVSIEPGDGGRYTVSFFNASGLQQMQVSRIIDTTAEATNGTASRRWTEKRLRAVLHGTASQDHDADHPADIDWQPGRWDSEWYFGVTLNPDTGWPEARQQLLEAWRRRPAALSDTRIAAIATEFQYRCPLDPVTTAPGRTHLPSAGYPDPLSAFEAGVTLATEESA